MTAPAPATANTSSSDSTLPQGVLSFVYNAIYNPDTTVLAQRSIQDALTAFGISATSAVGTTIIEVFKSDGSTPTPWKSRTPKRVRVLSEIKQAFTHPPWEQSGTPVYYEFLLNQFEYDYIVENGLHNQEGQAQFFTNFNQTGGKVNFGLGSITTPSPSQKLPRTQVTRAIPISDLTMDVNREVQQWPRDNKSVWRFYELVGTQYITNIDSLPTASGEGDQSITNHSGGAPTPAYLANTILETYLQAGNQESDLVSKSGTVPIFATSSCMSCDFDAGLLMLVDNEAINVPSSADLSWLSSMAKSQKKKTHVLNRRSSIRD